MRRSALALICLVGTAADAAHAEGALSCRWQPGTTAIEYASGDGKAALATDVRALVQGAQLVATSGAALRLEPLTGASPLRATEPLVCRGDEAEPSDGLIELTFSRKVRLGIDYTLAKCQLFYRCPGAAEPGARSAPQLYLGFVRGDTAVSRAARAAASD